MEVKEVTFSYERAEPFLKSVSGNIPMGKITTVIGPNGSGKSTLLALMSKNYLPKSGQIILDGQSIGELKLKELAKKLAVVHQQNEAPQDMTVEKLVSYGRLPHKSLLGNDSADDEEAIEWALTCTNLQEMRKKTLVQLSGGERQRVWIAMALAQKTSLLFLDEPTTYLDIYYQFEILELIKQLNIQYGLTIVMVLHDINQAIRYSDHLIVMKKGQVLSQGSPNEVISADVVKDIYGVNVMIKEEERTGLYIVPLGI